MQIITAGLTKKTKIRFVVLISVGFFLSLFSLLFACWWLGPRNNNFAKEKFYYYSSLSLSQDCHIFAEDHDISFTDEYYSVKIQCSPISIDRFLSMKPPWAKADWKKGKKSFFRNHITEIGDQYYMIYGAEGATVCRTIVIDKNQNILEFEYITF